VDHIGRYEVIEELGRGTAGAVYKAYDPTISRLVAIKVLSLPSSASRGSSGAISGNDPLREARMAGCLAHPNIVTIYDAVADEENKLHYIVIEYVEGKTLERILAENPLPPVNQVLDWVRQTAEALDYAHQRQIIHRDLKPANILVTEKGKVKITDFGIAKNASLEATVSTMALAGTPSYMSPEQITGGKLEGRSDLFSLGIIFYEMLVGQRPFAGELATVMFKTVYEDIVPLRELRPEISPETERTVLRCLAKDPRQRYASAAELLSDLNRTTQASAGGGSAEEGAAPVTVPQEKPRPAETAPSSLGPEAHRRARWIYAGVAAGVGVVALAALAFHRFRLLMTPVQPPAPLAAAAPPPPARAWRTTSPLIMHGRSFSSEKGAIKSQRAAPVKPHRMPTPTAASVAGGRSPSSSTAPVPEAGSGEAVRFSSAHVRPSPSGIISGGPLPVKTKEIRLICRYAFAKGELKLSSGSKPLLTRKLVGKKKRRLLFIGGGYEGRLAEVISVPASLRQIIVQASSGKGGRTFTTTVPIRFNPASHSTPVLRLVIDNGRLRAEWIATSSSSR
jgi:serine/threonine-protein kinase